MPIQPDPRYFDFGGRFQQGYQRTLDRQQNAQAMDMQKMRLAAGLRRDDMAAQEQGRKAAAERLQYIMRVAKMNPAARPQLEPQFREAVKSFGIEIPPTPMTEQEWNEGISMWEGESGVGPLELQQVGGPEGPRVVTQGGKAVGSPRWPEADNTPSGIEEFQRFQAMSPEEQAAYLNLKRANATPQAAGNIRYAQKEAESDQKFVDAWPKAENMYRTSLAEFDMTNRLLDRAEKQANGWTTGIMGDKFSAIAGTPQYDLKKTLDPILASIGFNKLQDMRNNSPTGGALGQVSERELNFLQSTIASLDQAQSEEQFRFGLRLVRQAYERYKQAAEDALKKDAERVREIRGKYDSGGSSGEQSRSREDILRQYGVE